MSAQANLPEFLHILFMFLLIRTNCDIKMRVARIMMLEWRDERASNKLSLCVLSALDMCENEGRTQSGWDDGILPSTHHTLHTHTKIFCSPAALQTMHASLPTHATLFTVHFAGCRCDVLRERERERAKIRVNCKERKRLMNIVWG